MTDYQALELTQEADTIIPQFTTRTLQPLESGQVQIKVDYSSINFKDALTLNAKSGVLHHYPQIPGIDAAGVIVNSASTKLLPGTAVVVTGFGLGINHPGGFAEYITVPESWVVPLSNGLTTKQAMFFGTAGFTAALSILTLRQHSSMLNPQAPLLVTGTTGGVGGLALMMLHQLGYQDLTAVTRQPQQQSYLEQLGATQVINPAELINDQKRPLLKQQYTGVVDAVGGSLLNNLLPQISYTGAVALSGNAAGIQLAATTLPFILRGITLYGIDSVNVPIKQRPVIWQHLATDFWPTNLTDFKVRTVLFKDLGLFLPTYLQSPRQGRVIVKIS
ncbi:YhdH/YhfP family quinone oxidoreductase [Loigolactobacillus backii]|uniref:NADPH:quinone reductase n=1 Tax=Loigolactobacillus backii TaxID=375175 RepID=A0A192H4H7_9LACO|nr:YhdH/YhfP family quinone oxidoreductase [Loigolactobacillus backii]ANK59945.1 NADPH:quinone reductase [Loigolactobacillus backii]ANK63280.1 NADPH:quinone reductase [Loigolactobacillus backii]ANK64879.1 NADPH:quinone reductase [Loigolactobacillus backii]ANK66674.1 NADPH:quinone reductase [Loigolactobacillus backii]ANK69714.1 NADPH:quinone reductase [Loigolactobacillus backii]